MRKYLIVTVLVIIANIGLAQTVEFKEIGCGIISTKTLSVEKMSESASGNHIIGDTIFSISKITDTIIAKVGAEFGVEFILESSKSELVPLTITWKFPKGMKDINGKKIKETKYTVYEEANKKTYADYVLEGMNEVVPGEWTVEFAYKGKKLYQKRFFLVAEK